MADKKISELPVLDLGDVDGGDGDDILFPVAYEGKNYSVSLSALKQWVTSTTAGDDFGDGGDENMDGGDVE